MEPISLGMNLDTDLDVLIEAHTLIEVGITALSETRR